MSACSNKRIWVRRVCPWLINILTKVNLSPSFREREAPLGEINSRETCKREFSTARRVSRSHKVSDFETLRELKKRKKEKKNEERKKERKKRKMKKERKKERKKLVPSHRSVARAVHNRSTSVFRTHRTSHRVFKQPSRTFFFFFFLSLFLSLLFSFFFFQLE